MDHEAVFGAAAREMEPPGVGLAPAPEPPRQTVARIFDGRSLLGRGIWWEDGASLVVHVHCDLGEPVRYEEPAHTIADRVVAFTESDFPSLALQLEPGELHDVADARLIRDGIDKQRLRQGIGLRYRDQSAWFGHTEHLGDRRALGRERDPACP